jgi:asparagine synthase (glutamine-hydrolysing)
MCGIVGAVSSGNKIIGISERMSRAMELLNHRGPDDFGRYEAEERGVFLGHKRLSIVDLSEHGHQPMLSADNSIVLVFNGEIYNHKSIRNELIAVGHVFRGHSDTEVIIESYRRWGLNFLDKLNGTFSLAIYDKKQEQIHFARDRAGEKPFFYIFVKGVLYFASELTALIELSNCNRHIDPVGLLSYITRGYVLGDKTLLKDAYTLQPGHYASFNIQENVFHIERYWAIPKVETYSPTTSPREYEDELERLLENAVSTQLDCDVPTCILLSGGVDSSLLTALAARKTSQVRTFTVRFPGHPAFDETEKARLIARNFNTNHTEIDGVDVQPQVLMDLGNRLDLPINDSSLIPTFLVYEAVSKSCRVAIGGDGADELFGGYKHYSRMLALEPFAQRLSYRSVKRLFEGIKSLFPCNYRFRNWLECFGMDLEQEVPNIREIFSPKEAGNLYNHFEFDIGRYHTEWRSLSSGHGSLLRNCCASDFQTYLSSSILVKSDRGSMLSSVEARAPFLDRNVIDFAFSKVPDALRATSADRKIILKSLCARLLPPEFDLQRKLGFNLPFGDMIRSGGWRKLVGDVLLDDNGVLDKEFVKNIFNRHMSGINHSDQIFGLFMLSMWIRRNRLSIA